MKRKDFSDLKIETQKEKSSYFEHEEFIAGTVPFLRGIHPTMYLQNSIKTRILVDFYSAKKCNRFIKEKIKNGFKNFSIHFNFINNNPVSLNETNGIYITSLRDIKTIFKDIDLQNLELTISANNQIRTVLILFILGLKELNTTLNNLNLSIQLKTLKNEYSSINLSEIFEDIVHFGYKNIPKFNGIEISNAALNKTETPEIELANLLFTSHLIIQKWIAKNESVDTIASKISFHLKPDTNNTINIAKARAARMLWAKMIHQLHPKNQQSYALQLHGTIESSLNVFSAIFGGYQSLTGFETAQLIALEETNITKTVDPWAGSNYIEQKTAEITHNAWLLFEEKKNSTATFASTNNSEATLQQLAGYHEIKNIKFTELIAKAFEKNANLEAVFKTICN